MGTDLNRDLDNLVCRVELELRRRHLPFIDRDEVCKKFTASAVKELRRNGVEAENGFSISQMGGGGFDLWNQLQMVLEQRHFFEFLVLLVRLPKFLVSNYLKSERRSEKPLITVHLDIKSEKIADTVNFLDDLALRASVLCHAARTTSLAIAKEYPMYRFGFAVRIELPKNGYLAQIVAEDSENRLAFKRLCAAVSSLKFSNGLYLKISPSKLGLILYEAQKLVLIHDSDEGQWRISSRQRKYYMYFSSNILGNFYEKYSKKNARV